MWGKEVYGYSLYLLLYFPMNIKVLWKIKPLFLKRDPKLLCLRISKLTQIVKKKKTIKGNLACACCAYCTSKFMFNSIKSNTRLTSLFQFSRWENVVLSVKYLSQRSHSYNRIQTCLFESIVWAPLLNYALLIEHAKTLASLCLTLLTLDH